MNFIPPALKPNGSGHERRPLRIAFGRSFESRFKSRRFHLGGFQERENHGSNEHSEGDHCRNRIAGQAKNERSIPETEDGRFTRLHGNLVEKHFHTELSKDVFDKKCGVCHYADSDSKKIGPGLKGIGKRGTFTVNNNKVTDENLKTWIENGDSLMPPFKDVIDDSQIKDVIAYVKTL